MLEIPSMNTVSAGQNATSAGGSRPHVLLIIASVLIASAYLLQLASPLCLYADALSYLQLGSSLSDGHGYHVNGEPTHFPPGYPAFIAGLDRLGIANSLTFIAANLIMLAVGTIAAFFILRRHFGLSPNAALACCNVSLLSWVVVKFITAPATEIPFYGLSLLAVWTMCCLEDTRGPSRMLLAISSLVLIAAAILTRTIGIALLPAFLWAILGQQRDVLIRVFTSTRRRQTVCAALVVGMFVFAVVAISHTRYAQAGLGVYHGKGYLHMVITSLAYRATEFGSVGINLPRGLACNLPPDSFLSEFVRMIFGFVGLIFIVAVGYGLWFHRKPLSSLMIYILTYFGILIVWPYEEARYWTPIVPLLAGYVGTAMRRGMMDRRITRAMILLYLGWFVAMGMVTFGYSTRISLARGDRFGDLCAGGFYKSAYHAARNHQPLENIADENQATWNKMALPLFQRFESSCK